MCLIAYVPAGKALTRAVFDKAHTTNSDGIGVMSIQGVQKFFGSKALKRARNYVDSLVEAKVSHAVHWRFATHGTKQLALCHPFKLPNADVHFMHNGVIGETAQEASEDASDTLLYVNKMTDAPQSHEDLEYWNKVCTDIGRYNKACVMYPGGHFIILNKEEGVEIDGIWYSNQYSLPAAMRQTTNYFTPSRLRPNESSRWQSGGYWVPWDPVTKQGGYYETTRHSEPANRWGGPFGSMIYWSVQHDCYGFWENEKFVKLSVGKAPVQDTTVPASTPPPIELLPDPPKTTAIVLDSGERCPRCDRPKNRTHFYVQCYCEPGELARWYAAKGIKPLHGSGPDAETLTSGMTHEGMCEHGELSWENCRECINRLEVSPGYDMHSQDPQERANRLASSIIDLSRASEK